MGQTSTICCNNDSETAGLVAAADVHPDPAEGQRQLSSSRGEAEIPRPSLVAEDGVTRVSSKQKAAKISAQLVGRSQEQLEDQMESLLDDMESTLSSFSVKYRQYRISSSPKPMKEGGGFTSVDEHLHKVIMQVRRLQQSTKKETEGFDSAMADMYLGNKRKRLRSLPDIVRKVMAEMRIARLLKSWGIERRSSFQEGSFEAQAAELPISDWSGVNPFEVETKCQQPLTLVFYGIWHNSKLPDVFKVSKDVLLDMLRAVESGYTETNPFHSRVHAAEVTLMTYQIFSMLSAIPKWQSYFSEVDLMVLILSSAIHDIGHPAVNNDFMVKTKSDMALRYHDTAVLENFHLATAFELMKQKGVSLLEHKLPSPPVNSLRRRVIDIVLATDMAVHKRHIDRLTEEIEKAETDLDVDKRFLEQYIVHMADIGHALRPAEQHQEWTKRVSQEFYTQGDREKELGFTPLALFDREKAPPLGKGQHGFVTFVVQPLWMPLGGLLGHEADCANRCLQANIECWKEMAEQEEAEERE